MNGSMSVSAMCSKPHGGEVIFGPRGQQRVPRACVAEPVLCVEICRLATAPLRVLFSQPGRRRPLHQITPGRLSTTWVLCMQESKEESEVRLAQPPH